jgi:hypothetical protein
MTRTFISYHHANDQAYKDRLVIWASLNGLMQDMSVSTGEINDAFDSETIRRIIRDQYLRNSEVTILLAGRETRFRKHVDWELKSTMIDGRLNHRSGILVINLPDSGSESWWTAFPQEKDLIYPDYRGGWRNFTTQSEFQEMFPNMPHRILENLVIPGVKISIVPWERVFGYPDRFRYLLTETAKAGPLNQYDLSRSMRR